MGLITAAALMPAKPVPNPAPIPATKQMKNWYSILFPSGSERRANIGDDPTYGLPHAHPFLFRESHEHGCKNLPLGRLSCAYRRFRPRTEGQVHRFSVPLPDCLLYTSKVSTARPPTRILTLPSPSSSRLRISEGLPICSPCRKRLSSPGRSFPWR